MFYAFPYDRSELIMGRDWLEEFFASWIVGFIECFIVGWNDAAYRAGEEAKVQL